MATVQLPADESDFRWSEAAYIESVRNNADDPYRTLGHLEQLLDEYPTVLLSMKRIRDVLDALGHSDIAGAIDMAAEQFSGTQSDFGKVLAEAKAAAPNRKLHR